MEIIAGIMRESYLLFNEMSPYLLFGFLFAGILHIFIDTATIARHLGKNSTLSVIKAALFGIPLPLCSCGVLPASVSLSREGASKGAIVSFLISTPTTGVDSIFATYSLLGGFFAVFRIIASFITGTVSGLLTNIFVPDKNVSDPNLASEKCKLCKEHDSHQHSLLERIQGMLKYAFVELLSDTGLWLLVGILIGGIIAFFMPNDFISTYLASGWKAMVVMLLVGIPMYVCATGSIPIAAALMLKGMNPGAAFVFLMAGPATNAVSITIISKELGRRVAGIYLVSIAACSLALGWCMDLLWEHFASGSFEHAAHSSDMLPSWVKASCSAVLVTLIIYSLVKDSRKVRV